MYNVYRVTAYDCVPQMHTTDKRAQRAVDSLRYAGKDVTLDILVVNDAADSSYVLQTFHYEAR